MKCYPWTYKGFTLIGDAAHSMNPFSTQGFNVSVQASTVIDDLIDKYQGDWSKITEEYQRIRKPETDAVTDYGENNFQNFVTKFYNKEAQLAYVAQDYLDRIYPDLFKTLREYIRWTLLPLDKCCAYG